MRRSSGAWAALLVAAGACSRHEAPPAAHHAASAAAPTPPAPPAASGAPAPRAGAGRLAPIAAAEFARLFRDLSGPDHDFFSDNTISNETSVLQVAKLLDQHVPRGRAYIGVGPEQNFTYIALLQPRIAFIVDIRRDNALLHLLYKALFETARSRAEFVSLLLGRPYREAVDPGAEASVADTLTAVEESPPDAAWFAREHAALVAHIERQDGVTLRAADKPALDRAHRAFFDKQLELRFELKEKNGRTYPTLRELFMARAPSGRQLGFLASDARFRVVQTLEKDNRVIPVVGDFAGDHALRAVAAEIAREKLVLGAFYVSNVEQYVLQPPAAWQRWVGNVAAMPSDDQSVFIRCYLDQGRRHPAELPGQRTATVLQPLARFLSRIPAHPYRSFFELATDGNLGP